MTNLNSVLKSLCNGMLALLLGLVFVSAARADYVGELETTKYFDAATIALLQSRLPGGLLAGDQISYIIQFTPTDNGGAIGGGGYVTDYIPTGTKVVNAQFVRLDSSPAGYTQVAPPAPAAVTAAYLPLYSDTGIFFSTDPRTAMYTTPASVSITAANGYTLASPGCTGISLPSSTHNAWDNAMETAFSGAAGMTGGTGCTAPAISTYSSTTNGGLSPVAGNDAYLTLDYTGNVGPWQRIAYPGSMKATGTGVAGINPGSCVGGAPTTAGYALSPTNPLPLNTNAVRFAAGKVVVGELFTARITLQLTANMPASGIINNTEVFGGDASLDLGNAALHPSTWNQWRYFCPAVAVSNSNLMVLKTLVGTCIGTGCTPNAVTAGVVPNAANLKLRYQIQYLNTGSSAQTNVVLTDTFASGAAYVAGSAKQLSNGAALSPTAAGNPVVLTFPTIASLASGTGDTVQYDVIIATAQVDGTPLVNTATLVSTQTPSPGVKSKAITTVSSQANLWIGKTASSSTVASGGTVTYTISIPNNGGTAVTASAATPVTVNEYLPSDFLSTNVTDRFSYVAGSVTAATYTAAGVATTVTPTVTDVAPATAADNEAVTFTFTAGTIPIGGKLVITFNAKVGTNVPATATPYLNNANVFYAGGPGGAATNSSMSEVIGTAPVTVIAPMSLTKTVNCVYSGATCVPYANGTIPPGSKVKYRLDYTNISAGALSNVVVTDTLPPNTTLVTGTAIRDGAAVTPTVAGQVLTFTAVGLGAGASGYITFDAQLCTAVGTGCAAIVTSGTDITNNAKIIAATFPAGVQAFVTTSVRDQATLTITKTATPSTIQVGGTVTYTITVTNTGNAPASGIKIYDELPFTGTTVNPLTRFNFNTGTSAFAWVTKSTSTLVSVTPTTSVPPTLIAQPNQQEILWTFAAAQVLAKGDSFTLTYTATAGASIPASPTLYTSDVMGQYISATNNMQSSATSTAAVTIGGMDHILLVHDGMAGVCTADSVTIQACANASCSALYTGGVSVTMSPATGWAVNPVVIGATGVATGLYSQNVPGTVRYAVASQSVTSQSSFLCDNNLNAVAPNNTTECDGQFSQYEFVIASTDPLGSTAVAGRPHKMKVTAYRKQGTQCGIATNYQNNKTLFAAYADASGITTPSAPAAPQISLSSNCASAFPAGGLPATLPATSNITLNFVSGVVDPFYLCTSDVGKLSLEFRDTAPTVLTATTPTILVRPFTLYTTVTGNPAASTPTGTVFTTAGSNFAATVAGIQWQAADDVNNVGVPDAGANLADNGATAHYAWDTTLAADTTAGTFTGGTVVQPTGTTSLLLASFAGGSSAATLQYDEVGSFTLNAAASNYLNAGVNLTGSAGVVGRFIPHHFNTTVGGPLGCASPSPFVSCPAGNMVYSGQTFASTTVTAMNAKAATTVNYQGAFAKAVTLSAVASSGGAAVASGTLTAPSIVAGTFVGGIATASVAGANLPKFTLADLNPLDVYLHATDTEASSGGAGSTEGGVKVIAGRVKVANAYGSELLPLTLSATAQFYASATIGWVTSITDSVTTLTLSASYNVVSNGVTTGTTSATTTPAGGTMSNGKLSVKLSKPGVKGVATINPTLPSYFPAASGTATFGIYAAPGGNSIIYQRESY